MMKSKSFSIIFCCAAALQAAAPATASAAIESNVEIVRRTDRIVLEPDKSGSSVAGIRRSIRSSFTATRVPAEAVDYVGYNDFIKIDKASVKSKGVSPVYESATDADVFYDDSRICAVPVPLPQVGKTVDTRFDLTYTRPEFEPLIYLCDIYPVREYELTVTMPVSLKDRYDIVLSNPPEGVGIDRQISKDGCDWVITVTARDLKVIRRPADAPPARYVYPYAQLKGRFADVGALYSELHGYTLGSDPQAGAVAAKAAEITSGCDSPLEKAEAIFNWVNANIRYVAIEHGEFGQRPDSPGTVLANRFGDCKGSASLIKGMLRAVGLDGRLVWLGTSDIPEEFTERPVISSGNHMIAALMLPGDSAIYLDGTVGLADFGTYSDGTAGRQTIIEDGDNFIIGRVPRSDASASASVSDFDLRLDGQDLTGTVARSMSGNFKAKLLNAMHAAESTDKNELLSRCAVSYGKAWEAEQPEIGNGTPGNGSAVITAKVATRGGIIEAGGKKYLNLNLFPGLNNMIFDMKEREHDGWIGYSGTISNTFRVSLGSSLAVSGLPEPLSVCNKWMRGDVRFSFENNILTCSFTLSLNSGVIPLGSLESVNADLKRLSDASRAAVALTGISD